MSGGEGVLLKWPLEAELGAIRAKILVETAPTFDGLDSLCKSGPKYSSPNLGVLEKEAEALVGQVLRSCCRKWISERRRSGPPVSGMHLPSLTASHNQLDVNAPNCCPFEATDLFHRSCNSGSPACIFALIYEREGAHSCQEVTTDR